MTEPRSTNPGPVTGVASGGLGTAANLEDTQLWSLEDLRAPEAEPAPEAVPAPEPTFRSEPVIAREPSFPAASRAVASSTPVVASTPLVAPAPVVAVAAAATPRRAPVVERVRPRRINANRPRPRAGVLAVAAVGILALAAMFALRDGLPGGSTRGGADAAGAFPSAPALSTAAPAPTTAPAAGGGGGKGNDGKGNGKGNGNDGKKN